MKNVERGSTPRGPEAVQNDSTRKAVALRDVETFHAPWPAVLAEMKDFVNLRFITAGEKVHAATLRVFISKALVPESLLQPHVREFKAAIARIPHCRVELKGTEQPVHRIEIDYRR